MTTAREYLADTSEKLRLAVSTVKAVDEGYACLTVNLDTLSMSEAAARVEKAAKMAAKEATTVLEAARAAEAAATRAAKAVETADAAAQTAAKAEEVAEAAARASEAAAAAVELTKVAPRPRLPWNNT